MTSLAWTEAAAEIPDGGLALDWLASSNELAALAADLDIVGVDRASLKGRITSRGDGRYRLYGTLEAQVVQACVVTLEPVTGRIVVPLDLELMPEEALATVADADPDAQDEVEAPIVEPIRNGIIDVGEIVYQEIAAALDPYPRASDATLDRTEAGPSDDEVTNPFAKLKKLQLPKQD